METPKFLLKTLKALKEEEFKEFKWHLQEEVLELPGIPKSELEKADRMETVDLMRTHYGRHDIKVTREVLKEIPRNDLLEALSESSSESSSDRKGEKLLSAGREDPLCSLDTLSLH
ncbi:NACHT, LRR and PYD domains-containing protein 4-like [Trematomus bernacchii]|uniref:NACHT, LRR and PYD domains-containing protein 4-like n=1 Tax=Trematomus bernacchii TaxID=40690 RepID=UPI00146DB4C6|nr:NACHT, LRR and PYD domains-containing protein 4-like [Trematomus bernacchii]